MSQSNTLPVACFAPPLTDELLARYESLIAGLTSSAQAELRDAMQTCLNCVKVWWELPESTRRPKKWLLTNTKTGAEVEFAETPLEESHIKQLCDVTPWMRELVAMRPLIESVQADEAHRNGLKKEAWQAAVQEVLLAAEFSAEDLEYLRSTRRKMLRAVLKALSRFGEAATPFIAPVMLAFGTSKEYLADIAARRQKVDAAIGEVLSGRAPSPVPLPVLESTELRDAARHLFWHCEELTLDHEPLTKDKLGV